MIEIYVKGKKLTLYSDTTINIELNNALFASESIEGDYTYSFELPTDNNNSRILGFENNPAVREKTEHPCTISKGGIQILKGNMHIQKADKERITAAVICSDYPDGFREKSINKNECEEIVVSRNIEEHKIKWAEYIQQCTDTDGDIKFAPFINEECYGQENEDFGFREGYNKGKVVNRIRVSREGTIEMAYNEEKDLVDEDGLYIEKNQECLCPQIRLTSILKNIADNAGYRLIDNINEELNRIFIQAVKLLDGDSTQFGVLNRTKGKWKSQRKGVARKILTEENYNMPWEGADKERYPMVMDWDENTAAEPALPTAGRYHIMIEWGLARCATPDNNTETYLLIYKEKTDREENILVRHSIGMPNEEWTAEWNTEKESMDGGVKYTGRVYVPPTFLNTPIKFAVKQHVKTWVNGNWEKRYTSNLRGYMQVQITGPVRCTLQNALNIYSARFKANELLPDVTNGDFIKKTITSLGLNWFTSTRSKTIEVSSYRDTKEARSVDISALILRNETAENRTERKKIKFKVSQVQEFDREKEEYKGETNVLNGDPELEEKNEVWLYTPANGYVKAEEEEDEDESWKMSWKLKGGNGEALETGEGEEEEVKTEMKAPANTTALEYTTLQWSNLSEEHNDYGLPNIPLRMATPMSEERENNPHDIIMLYYRGKSSENRALTHGEICENSFEMMQAAYPGEFSLKAKGEKSLGEEYMLDYIKTRKINDRMTYKLYADTRKLLEITETLMPQEVTPQNQVRFIYADGVKSVPEKIKIELRNGVEKVLIEIEAAKLH
jgi:hypothetical protein